MFYNQNYENSYNFDTRKNNDRNNNNRECRKGYCTVKVIQECCYPSYWDYEEDKKDNCMRDDHDNCDKHENKKYEACCYNQEKKEEHNCSCRKEDKWEEKDSCHNHHNNKCCCKQRNSSCGFCSCFRRW